MRFPEGLDPRRFGEEAREKERKIAFPTKRYYNRSLLLRQPEVEPGEDGYTQKLFPMDFTVEPFADEAGNECFIGPDGKVWLVNAYGFGRVRKEYVYREYSSMHEETREWIRAESFAEPKE